ncbi:hypothetical protein MP228_010958 [Amoeboaphelidium protococcarum]|nr:hypothetical protein MP228_010958 [Amoeboaphelidium protococcarum]
MAIDTETPTPCLIKVTNIDASVSREKIKEFFDFCGSILGIEITASGDQGQSALIMFDNPTSSNTATMLTQARLGGSPIKVSYYHSQYSDLIAKVTEQQGAEARAASAVTAAGASGSTRRALPRDFQAQYIASQWIADGVLVGESLIQQAAQTLEKIPLVKKSVDTVYPIINTAVTGVSNEVRRIDQTYEISKSVSAKTGQIATQATERLNSLSSQYPAVKNMMVGASMIGNVVNESIRIVQDRHREQHDHDQMKSVEVD